MRVNLITTRSELETIREEWQELYYRAGRPSPFLQPTWLLAWLEAYAPSQDLACLMLRKGNQLVGMAPLLIDAKHGVRVLRSIGDGRLDYLGFLVATDEADAWPNLGRALSSLGNWDAINLRSWCLGELPHRFREQLPHARFATRVFEHCPFVEISSSFPEFLASKRSKFRKWLRQIERQTTAHGTPQSRLVDADSLSQSDIDGLISLERRGRYWREGTAHFQDPRFAVFLKAALRRGSSGLHIHLVEFNGIAVAAELLAESDGVIYGIWTAYDADFNAAGSYVVNEAVKGAFDRGCRRFDFMQGDQNYKRWWATGSADVQEIILARGLRGSAWMAMVRLRWYLSNQAWARRLRARITRTPHRSDALHGEPAHPPLVTDVTEEPRPASDTRTQIREQGPDKAGE